MNCGSTHNTCVNKKILVNHQPYPLSDSQNQEIKMEMKLFFWQDTEINQHWPPFAHVSTDSMLYSKNRELKIWIYQLNAFTVIHLCLCFAIKDLSLQYYSALSGTFPPELPAICRWSLFPGQSSPTLQTSLWQVEDWRGWGRSGKITQGLQYVSILTPCENFLNPCIIDYVIDLGSNHHFQMHVIKRLNLEIQKLTFRKLSSNSNSE